MRAMEFSAPVFWGIEEIIIEVGIHNWLRLRHR